MASVKKSSHLGKRSKLNKISSKDVENFEEIRFFIGRGVFNGDGSVGSKEMF